MNIIIEQHCDYGLVIRLLHSCQFINCGLRIYFFYGLVAIPKESLASIATLCGNGSTCSVQCGTAGCDHTSSLVITSFLVTSLSSLVSAAKAG